MSGKTDCAKQRRDGREQHGKYEQDLLAAKKDGTVIRFTLDIPSMVFDGTVLYVDRFQVKIKRYKDDVEMWLNKGHIVCTENWR